MRHATVTLVSVLVDPKGESPTVDRREVPLTKALLSEVVEVKSKTFILKTRLLWNTETGSRLYEERYFTIE